MKFLKFKTYEEMSAAAADIFAKQINIKNDSVLGLATGSTPIGMYRRLIEMNRSGIIDFSKIKSVNLDEYYPISPENPQSYRYFMNVNLFDHVNIDKANTYVPNGATEDADAECRSYDEIIKNLGGVDIQVLGIGQNGHIGFNEPARILDMHTHKTQLTQSTLDANARFFSDEEIMPREALTVGMGTIFGAKKIILLISGESKREVFKRLITDEITTDCPATLLKLHPNVTVLCDLDACGE